MSAASASWPDAFLDALARERDYDGQIVHREEIAARPSAYQSPDPPLPGRLKEALAGAGVTRLYSHQTESLEALRAGEDVIVATGTASGKSLCYGLAIAERALEHPGSTALYLAPTKALAASQRELFRRMRLPGVVAETYDGDTPQQERRIVRGQATLVLTNPDMLHMGILPNHSLWSRFLRSLAFVVVDEAHSLRGVFGSHVALMLRRLQRVADHYGASPRFVYASATCANPRELAALLGGREARLVDEDGAPRGPGVFALWNPPVIEEASQRRLSANSQTAELAAELARAGRQTLAFSKSRQGAELIRRYTRDRLDEEGKGDRVGSYRGGYLADERRAVEAALASGELLVVSTTNALELGVDIPGVDAVLENGFPGTVSSFWQQAGRAGRGRSDWLALMVGHEDPLEQYYIAHPEMLFGDSHEAVRLDPTNPYILRGHVACASAELPMDEARDREFLGPGLDAALADLDEAGLVGRRNDRWYWRGRSAPGDGMDIRSTGGGQYSIVEAASGALIGTIEASLAQLYVHPGAIYLHQGESYIVHEMDPERRLAIVEPFESEFYTQPRELSDVDVIEMRATRRLGADVTLSLGTVKVTTRVTGFRRLASGSQENLGEQPLELPPVTFEAHGVWLTLPDEAVSGLGPGARLGAGGRPGSDVPPDRSDRDAPQASDACREPGPVAPASDKAAGSLHAAEHGLIGMSPLLVSCDRWDLGGLSTRFHQDTRAATIFVYEGHAGGVGVVERLYGLAEEWLARTAERIAECGCEAGCPSCVQSPKCGNFNEPLDKSGSVELLRKGLS